MLWKRVASLWRNLARRDQVERELDEEIRGFLEMSGEAPVEAVRAKEAVRDARAGHVVAAVAQDARYAVRMMRKSPGFAAVAVATLALGAASAATLFSIVYAGLIKERGPNTDRVDAVLADYPERHLVSFRFSAAEFAELREQTAVFEAIGAIEPLSLTLGTGEYPERVLATRTTADMFAVDDAPPILGRPYREEEERVALISAELWERRFGRDPSIVGKDIELNQESYRVIGVMQPKRSFFTCDVALPLRAVADPNQRSQRTLWAIGLRRRDVSPRQADALLEVVGRNWEARYRGSMPEYAGLHLFRRNTAEWVTAGIRPAIYVLLGAVGLVLLICYANLANLLLARATARGREMALRAALGASRGRILRQLATEGGMLAVAGAAWGGLLAKWGVPLAASLIPYDWLPGHEGFQLEPLAVGVVAALSVVLGIAFGLAPGLHLSRGDLAATIRESGARAGGSRAGQRSRRVLVGAETALAIVILAGAGLMIRTYRELMAADLGFQPAHLLSLQIALPETKYAGGAEIARFYREVLPRVAALPGVDGVSISSANPMVDRTVDLAVEDFTIAGRPPADARSLPNAVVAMVSPDYFRVMAERLVRGRFLSASDGADAPRVAAINQTMARTYWGDTDPVGQRIESGGRSMTIAGVVADARQIRVIDAPVRPQMFIPLEHRPAMARAITMLVQSARPADAVAGAVRRAVSEVDRQQPVYGMRRLDETVADAYGPKRLTTALLGFFAAVALVLTVVGLYAVMAFGVVQRTQEIGIRMALGADRGSILRAVVGEGLRMAGAGVAVGLLGAVAAAGALGGLTFGVGAADPLTLAASAALLLAVAAAASALPAMRAAGIDPSRALRKE